MRFLREMLRPFSFRWPVGGTLQMTKARNAGEARRLADIPNIGPAMVEDFRNLGIEQPGQLAGKDPYALYERLCAVTGVRHDRSEEHTSELQSLMLISYDVFCCQKKIVRKIIELRVCNVRIMQCESIEKR